MSKKTREQKLAKQLQKAELCTSREEAQKIIKKAEKHRRKLEEGK
ncbi:hypothetical protein [Synechococcus phage S-N03]|uniref:Uncharacterized protein n=1 Tax=Synechococcus phage S-N03 TaxID=2718943 RepID=A0A6G8R5K8_9CAUD|nr:hypothetical protein PQC09_gp054 [Synechococcus phage S-N03]QIN96689.1 hypothetical protein [Synechococcus phage S-N03]